MTDGHESGYAGGPPTHSCALARALGRDCLKLPSVVKIDTDRAVYELNDSATVTHLTAAHMLCLVHIYVYPHRPQYVAIAPNRTCMRLMN